MSDQLLEWMKMGLPLILGLAVGWLALRFADPLKRLKELSNSPAVSILAAAAVMLAEAYWSDYGGEAQFEAACKWLAGWLNVPVDQVREIVQAAYDALRDILGDEWGALKLGLAPDMAPGMDS